MTIGNFSEQRYVKYSFNDLDHLPPIGKLDWVPRHQAFTMHTEGSFTPTKSYYFPIIKRNDKLPPLNRCIYCSKVADGVENILTSEHLIPEFLGAGLELPSSSCNACQTAISEVERRIEEDLFKAARKSLIIKGKNGTVDRQHFPVDIETTTTKLEFINFTHHPTILTLPKFYPAPMYSTRPVNSNNIFNIMLYNINAKKEYLDKYNIEKFCTVHIDKLRFCQFISKIALGCTRSVFRHENFKPIVSNFITTRYNVDDVVTGYMNHIGCLSKAQKLKSGNLHEVDVGKIQWRGQSFYAARVQLFSCYDMPSYHVVVGQ